ncbi:MAG: 23S rRNA (pseudouridine(1915)-N(3))-methyltransferase RlmH [Magnetococcales bacterium]|nr:23S rRNA (pseudouridine(1915)-N(3))-methyltransferase RlmH [Magnetococcales bacterium]
MKWTVLAVGRSMPPAIADLVKEYRSRLEPFGGVGLEVVAEERRDKGITAQMAMEREAERLTARIARGAMSVALDAGGRMYSSEAFSRQLDRWRQDAPPEILFMIGGPDGLAPSIKSAASQLLSLGPLTLPHMLARMLLFEQIYRAMTIWHGLPYHR